MSTTLCGYLQNTSPSNSNGEKKDLIFFTGDEYKEKMNLEISSLSKPGRKRQL